MKEAKRIKLTFLTDECVSQETIEFLNSLECEVSTYKNFNLAGAANGTVLNKAIEKKMIFLTEDQDFCNIRLYPPHLTNGIVVLKVTPQRDKEVWGILKSMIAELKRSDFEKALIVVNNKQYRVRRDPPEK